MNKKKIIILLTTILLSLSLITVFGAFVFRGYINGTANPGNIILEDKLFLDYSLSADEIAAPENSALTPLELLKKRTTGLPKKIDAKTANSITCYATERKGYDDEKKLIYLNQLGFEFSFTPEVDSYVRIHFEDAWISKKVYNNGSEKKSYITKDKLEGSKSPFDVSDINWVYDEETNCVYLKAIAKPANGKQSYSFNISSDYWYHQATPSKTFREQIMVQVSYVVDVVQANRAEAIWGVDLDNILGRS